MKLQAAVDKLKHKTTNVTLIVDYICYNALEFFKSEDIESELKELTDDERLYNLQKLKINF